MGDFLEQFVAIIRLINWDSFVDQVKEFLNIVLDTLKASYGK